MYVQTSVDLPQKPIQLLAVGGCDSMQKGFKGDINRGQSYGP